MVLINDVCNQKLDLILEEMVKENISDRILEVSDPRMEAYLNYLSVSENEILLDNEHSEENDHVSTHLVKVYKDNELNWHLQMTY